MSFFGPFRFAAASLLPVPLLLAGGLGQGAALWAALAYLVGVPWVLDRLAAGAEAPGGREFPASGVLLVALGAAHLGLMVVGVLAVAGATGLAPVPRVAAFVAFGLHFGQISIPAAHELIHHASRPMRALGVAVYISLMFGHHASAHRHVHHRHVGTARDPNSAAWGESFYRFAPQAWMGSFRAGLIAEGGRRGRLVHPYALYLGGSAACLAAAWGLAGLAGVAALAGLGAYATVQLLLSDYVQHYGLRRRRLPDGRLEPVGPQHAWNAPGPASAAMMLNAARHSDHHVRPSRPYPALDLAPEAPMLPRSLAVMATVALVPPLWRRMMHPRLEALARRAARPDLPG